MLSQMRPGPRVLLCTRKEFITIRRESEDENTDSIVALIRELMFSGVGNSCPGYSNQGFYQRRSKRQKWGGHSWSHSQSHGTNRRTDNDDERSRIVRRRESRSRQLHSSSREYKLQVG